MQLKVFVKTALTEIMGGVEDAQVRLNDPSKGQANPRLKQQATSSGASSVLLSTHNQSIHLVKFDVAISVEEGTETKGGIGIFIGAVGLGSQGESTNSQTSLSRIQFEVPVSFPYLGTEG